MQSPELPDIHAHPHHVIAVGLWEAVAAGDRTRIGRLVAPKAVWHVAGASPLSGTYWGTDGLLSFLGSFGELIEGNLELLDVLVSADGAAIRYCIGANRGEREIQDEQVALLRIVKGRVEEGVFSSLDQLSYDAFLSRSP